ncbi:MAG: thioredoxin domain-containing protein [Bacteroidales bacterium]|nr:thioredoxin domain-containing protein [Bacteroidales bacterium]
MNAIIFFAALIFAACSGSSTNSSEAATTTTVATASVKEATFISEAEFKKLVMNFEANPEEWIFEGEIPCIVSFTASWCAPCRRMAPILDELARDYAGKVNIYKVDVDHNRKVSAFFGVQSIPTMLFARMKGLPALQPGGMGKEQLVNAIENFLLKDES